jgi:hypothetical protein
MRKGQSALEFLMTYGWAIMVILVMIGALAYFGVFDIQDRMPERCMITTGIDCADFMMNSTTLKIYVTNNEGSSLSYINLSSTSCSDYTVAYNVAGGSKVELSCTISAKTTGKGNKFKMPITIAYQKTDSIYPKIAYGEVLATIQ